MSHRRLFFVEIQKEDRPRMPILPASARTEQPPLLVLVALDHGVSAPGALYGLHVQPVHGRFDRPPPRPRDLAEGRDRGSGQLSGSIENLIPKFGRQPILPDRRNEMPLRDPPAQPVEMPDLAVEDDPPFLRDGVHVPLQEVEEPQGADSGVALLGGEVLCICHNSVHHHPHRRHRLTRFAIREDEAKSLDTLRIRERRADELDYRPHPEVIWEGEKVSECRHELLEAQGVLEEQLLAPLPLSVIRHPVPPEVSGDAPTPLRVLLDVRDQVGEGGLHPFEPAAVFSGDVDGDPAVAPGDPEQLFGVGGLHLCDLDDHLAGSGRRRRREPTPALGHPWHAHGRLGRQDGENGRVLSAVVARHRTGPSTGPASHHRVGGSIGLPVLGDLITDGLVGSQVFDLPIVEGKGSFDRSGLPEGGRPDGRRAALGRRRDGGRGTPAADGLAIRIAHGDLLLQGWVHQELDVQGHSFKHKIWAFVNEWSTI